MGLARGMVVVATLLVGVGCKPSMLPGSNIESTLANRQIASLVESYRSALESLKAENVMKLVSTEYFEDNGTSDPSDDYDYRGLQQRLEEDLKKVQVMRVSTRLHKIDVDGDRAYVDFRFQTRSLLSLPAGEQWITRTDDNRLTLRREDGQWKIVSGA